MVNEIYIRKLGITNIPKVYYNTRSSDLKKVMEDHDIYTEDMIITGDSPKKRTILLTSILKEIMKKKPGCIFYRFDIMIEHFRENKFLDLLEVFKGKGFVAIDNMDFNYMGTDYWQSNVFRRFCSFLRELHESSSSRKLYITTPHTDSNLESNLPKFLWEIFDGRFTTINL